MRAPPPRHAGPWEGPTWSSASRSSNSRTGAGAGDMRMTLYHGEPNGPSLTVLATLFAKEVQAELVRIDLESGQRHTLPCAQEPLVAMSVEGEGAVLVVAGEAMTDSVFIACYLDDVGPGAALRPADPYGRWETMHWCRQMTERTAPAAAYLGCWATPPRAGAWDRKSTAGAEGEGNDDHQTLYGSDAERLEDLHCARGDGPALRGAGDRFCDPGAEGRLVPEAQPQRPHSDAR